ncbi:MAG: RidA family protein [Alphaproteobacteria bacterium]|jgi:enamine deaminase RidA (YjgF/YER057c/UK114 family)
MSQNTPRPVPQGRYLPAIRNDGLIYTSGFTPRHDGKLIHSGKIKNDVPVEEYRDAVHMATQNAIWAAQACLGEGETISIVLQLNVYLNAEANFKAHSKLADYASDLLVESFDVSCIGSRTAVGVETLPSDASVEVNLVVAVSGE